MFSGKVAILDEPFSALDMLTKAELHSWYMDIMKEIKLSTLFITHDIDEALYLGDKVFVLGDRPLKIKRVFEEIKDIDKEKISKYI